MRKLTAFLYAAPLGLGTGLLAWLLAGGVQANADALAPAQAALHALRPPRPAVPAAPYMSVADLVSSPIFSLVLGAAAQPVPAIRLDGVSLSRQRTAALVSIGGATAEWLRPGDSRSDITLKQVAAAKIVVDTPSGVKEVALGQTLGTPQAGPAAPPEGRGGLPPASAPPAR